MAHVIEIGRDIHAYIHIVSWLVGGFRFVSFRSLPFPFQLSSFRLESYYARAHDEQGASDAQGDGEQHCKEGRGVERIKESRGNVQLASSMGMFAGNGAPISNVSFIIVSRFPLQDFELTGHDDASKFVSNINGSIEKIAHKISGGSVNYIGPDRLKPCIPYVLPALLNGILTDREWVQGAQKINTAWRTYYDSNNYFCLLTKERLLREIGAVLVLFLLAGLSSIKGVVGTIFGILTIVYLIGLLCVLTRLMGGREIMRTQPMWRVLKEVHENTFSRKVKISWTPAGSFGRRKSGIAGTGTRYVIEKFCVEILRNGHANGQPQMVIGQQTMLQPQMVTFANE